MGVNVSYINNVLADSIVGFSGIYDLPENFKDIKLTDLTSISGENFGLSICISDLYLTVGSPLYNLDENGQNQLTNSGAVFIFKRNVDTWEYFKTIFAPTRTSNENFGYSVSNTDKIIVVGTNGTSKSYIYNIELKDVSLIETLTETSSTNAYGNSVYCTDDNVFISDINSSTDPDGNSLPSNSGAVYIYNETNNWNRTQKLCISNGDITSNDQLGNSIDLLNNTVAVSSISRSYDENNINYLKNSGSVYILSITQSGISLIKEIVSPSRTVNAQFGKKVLFNSNGGLFVSDNKNLYFYNINSNGTWEYVSTLIDNSSTSFMISDYDINDFFVVSGYNGTTSVINLYKFNNTTNTLTSITSYTPVHNIDSNTKISTIDNMILVGNSSYNTNTGVVDLLTITSDINSETSAVTYSITSQSINGFASDRNSGDDFGNNILYNDLSKTIIVSAPNNSYDNNIENYISKSGSVYIWKINNDGTLTNTQKITSENRIENGLFGSIMATSNNLLVIPDSISAGSTKYNINVYKFNNGIWEIDNKIPSEILLNSQISTDGTSIAWFSNNSGVSNIRVVNYIQSVTDITTIDISFLTDSIYNHNISILGDTILVVDPHYDINGGTGSLGKVFVYKNTNNIWSKYGTISGWGQSRNSNDLFGSQVICKNNYMYISAPNYSYDINAKNYISNSGLVYVYTLKSDGTYSLSQKIQSNYRSSNTGTYSFGFTMAASDTNVLYISNKYSSSSSGWIEEFILVNGKYEFSQYIGTPTTTSNTTNPGGAVWWYEDILFISMIGTSVTSYIQDSTGKWNLDNTFKRTDIPQTTYDSSDSFGSQIKYKKGLLLISAYTDNYDSQGNNSLTSAGSVYIYNNTPQNSKNVWTPVQKIAGQVFVTGKQTGDLFGQVVSYYNGYIIVSSPGNSYDTLGQNYVSSSGVVYLFTVDSDGNLNQKQKIVSPNRTSNGQFGRFIKVVNDRLYILGETNLYEYIFNNNSYTYNSTISIPDIWTNNISFSGNFLVYWNVYENFVVLSRNTDNTWNNIASILAGDCTTATIYDDILIHNYDNGNLATLHVYKLNKNTVTKLYEIDPIGSNNPSITNVYSKNKKLFLSDTTNNLIYVFDVNSTDGSYTFSQVLSIDDIKNSLNTYNSSSSQFGNTVKLSDNNTLAIGFKNASYTINTDVSNTPYNNAGAVILYNLSDNSTQSSKNIKTFTTDSTFTVSDNMTGKIRFHVFGDIGTNTNNTNLNNYVCFEENVVSGTVYRMFIGNQGVNTISSFNGFTDTSNKISGAATIIRKNDNSENIVIVGGATTSTTPLDSYYNTTSPENSTYKYTGGNGYKIGISGDNGSNGSNYIDSNLTVLENFYNISSADKLSALKTQFSTGNYGSVVIEYVEVSESSFGKFEFLQDITPQNINDYNTSDQFGTSLDVTNNLLVVTSQNNDYDQNGENTSSLVNTGAAWIYSNTSGSWKQEQKIVPTGTNARNSNDYFGAACSIFNGMVIVSSVNHSYDISGNNSSNLTNVGAAWVWSKDTTNNTWKQIDKLCPLGSENATDYNFSIDKHNNEIVIGSPTANSNGSVYIVNVDSNNNITFNQKIVSPKPYTNGNFGYKVKYYNSKLYISEPGYTTIDTTGTLTNGIVYEFTLNSTATVYELSNTITSKDTNILTLGYDFDISNNKMIIGCPNSTNIC